LQGLGNFLIVSGIVLALFFKIGLPIVFEYSADVKMDDPYANAKVNRSAGEGGKDGASPNKKSSPFATGALFRIGKHGALDGANDVEQGKKEEELKAPRQYVRKFSLAHCKLHPGREQGISPLITTMAHDHMFSMTHLTMIGNTELGSARVDIGMGLLLRAQLLARKTHAHRQRILLGEAQASKALAAAVGGGEGEEKKEHHHHHHAHANHDKEEVEEVWEFHDEEEREFHDDMACRPNLKVVRFDSWHIDVGWSTVIDLHAQRHIDPSELVLLSGVVAASPRITEIRLAGCPICGPVWHDVGVMRRAHRSGRWQWEGILALAGGLLTDPRASLSRPLLRKLAEKQAIVRKKTEEGYRGSVGTGSGEWGGLPRNTRLRVRWQIGGRVWYSGTVVDYIVNDYGIGYHMIEYDDGQTLQVNMKRKEYKLLHEKPTSQARKDKRNKYDPESYDWSEDIEEPKDALACRQKLEIREQFVPAAKLRILDLSNTDIGGWNAAKVQPRWDLTGWAMLCDAFKTNGTVVELHVGSNQLRPPHLVMLLHALRRNTKLEKVRMDHSRFVLPKSECYPTWFKGCRRARMLKDVRYVEGRVPVAKMLQTGHEQFIDEDMDETAIVELGSLLQSADFTKSALHTLDLSFCDLNQGKIHLRGRYEELVQEWCDQFHVQVLMDSEDKKLAPMFQPKVEGKHHGSIHPFFTHGDDEENADDTMMKKKKKKKKWGFLRKKNVAAVAAVGAVAGSGASYAGMAGT
jgi:hypothetical protein